MAHDVGFDLDAKGLGVIEPGIKKLVAVLWLRGLPTICSCEGHLSRLEPVPWVVLDLESEVAGLVEQLFLAVARFNLAQGRGGNLPKAADTWVLSPQLPLSGNLYLYLRPQALNPKKSRRELSRLQESGIRLAKFIEESCLDILPAR